MARLSARLFLLLLLTAALVDAQQRTTRKAATPRGATTKKGTTPTVKAGGATTAKPGGKSTATTGSTTHRVNGSTEPTNNGTTITTAAPTGDINATTLIPAAKNCPALTAVSVSISQIQGVWYIQAYTPPLNGPLATKCDVFTISADSSNSQGSITYNFRTLSTNVASTQVATITAMPHLGQFQYRMSVATTTMITTVIVFRPNDEYAHLACSEDGLQIVLVVATKDRNPPDSKVNNLINEAASRGALTSGVQRVDQSNCF